MKKLLAIFALVIVIVIIAKAILGGSGKINTIPDPHFTETGELIKKPVTAKIDSNAVLRFYVESSGSMNGFFRNGIPTGFKHDVYDIMSYYSNVTKDINIMSDSGGIAGTMSLPQFQQAMNVGALQSNASTRVTTMLQSIISQLHSNEVAVLISDMKYSPVGLSAPAVLLSQYAAEIAKIAGNSNKSFCLIGAISNYVDRTGTTVAKSSPYYYLVIGDQDKVSFVRNGISSLLEKDSSYVDNMEFGYKYAQVPYSFGIPKNVVQFEKQPSFAGYDDGMGYCESPLKLHIEAYRWILADPNVLRESFSCKSLYGSKVLVTDIKVDVNNFTDQKLERSAVATIRLKVSNMSLDTEVLEWNLKIPESETTSLNQFFGATDENDLTKSYSIEQFITGISQGGIVNTQPSPNYILISKKNP